MRPYDPQKIFEYDNKSAELGYVAARYNMALNSISGVVTQNGEKWMNELRVFAMASGHLLFTMRKHRIWDDQDENFNSCVKRITEYTELDEPYALFRLGIFHQDAGDLENAVAATRGWL